MDKKDLFVVTSAFPFVPADLNLAHFSSTYVPADVAYRYLKCFKYNVIQVNATDVHSFFGSIEKVNSSYRVNAIYKQKFNAKTLIFAYFSVK